MSRVNSCPGAALPAAVLLAVGLASASASAQLKRFGQTTTGGVVATGNTLGLSKELNANRPGLEDSIGTFISLSAGSIDILPPNLLNPWPTGTTSNWVINGSAAVLSLPLQAGVLHAELVWGGSSNYVEDVTALLGTPVTIAFQGGPSTSAPPDATTALTITETSSTGFAANYYMRSANVTAFVAAHGSGTYSVSGAPATQSETINSLNAAGWTLVVAYSHSEAPARNLSVFVGGSFVDEDSQQDYTVSGFCTPPTGPVAGRVVVSAIEGDADLPGDELAIDQTAFGLFPKLSGPNNPVSNFFASQINGPDGMLDTRGTFGSANHSASLSAMTSGGRQGWDITTIGVSAAAGQLANAQTTAVLRTTTTGDSYVPVLVAFEIDVNSPDFADSTVIADVTSVGMGGSVVVTVTATNTGEEPTDFDLVMPLDPALALVAFATDGLPGDALGQPVLAAALSTGVNAGTLAPGGTRTFDVDLDVTGAPADGVAFSFAPRFDYGYISCAGDPRIDDQWSMTPLTVAWEPPDAGAAGAAGMAGSGAAGQGGSAGSGAGAGGAAADGGSAGSGLSAGAGGEAGSAGSAAASSGGGAGSSAGGAGPVDSGASASSGTSGVAIGNRPVSGDDGSCGCAMPGARSGSLGVAALGLIGMTALQRRRARERVRRSASAAQA